MLVLGSDFKNWTEHIGKIFDKDVFAERSISIDEFCFLVELVSYFFEFSHVEVDKAGGSFGELAVAEGVWVKGGVPRTILLNFFI